MSNEIVKIDPETKNLPIKIQQAIDGCKINDLSKAEKIAQGYAVLMERVDQQIQLLKKLEKGNIEDVPKAKRIRLDLGVICSESTAQKGKDKAMLLLETRLIDSFHNIVDGSARITQTEAKEIENHLELLEKKRLNDLQNERVAELSQYVEDASERRLCDMEPDVWEAFLQTKINQHNEKIEAELKAETERQAAIEAERLERERIAKENERLKKEAVEREKAAKIQAEKIEKERQERQAKEKAEYKKRQEAAAKEKAAQDAKLKAEREEKERIAAKLKAQQDAEKKRIAEEAIREESERRERQAAIEKELKKGDADKVNDLINDLEMLKNKYSFESKENKAMYKNVGGLIDKIVTFIKPKNQL